MTENLLNLYKSFNLNTDKPRSGKTVRTMLCMDNGNTLTLSENNPIFIKITEIDNPREKSC